MLFGTRGHNYSAIPAHENLEISAQNEDDSLRKSSSWSIVIKLFPVFVLSLLAGIFLLNTSVHSQIGSTDGSVTKFSEMSENAKLTLFGDFVVKFGKDYQTQEEKTSRFEIFKTNLATADELNEFARKQGTDGEHGVTMFSDLTKEEFKAQYTGKVGFGKLPLRPKMVKEGEAVLGSVDWSKSSPKLTTPVKKQGSCNCCYAFAITQQMESDAIRLGVKGASADNPLSPQQIVSCGKKSCNTWSTVDAMTWVVSFGGLVQESAFPYASSNGVTIPSCSVQKSQAVLNLARVADNMGMSDQDYRLMFDSMYPYGMSFTTEEEMADYVLHNGPVTAAVNTDAFMSYKSGVMSCTDGEDSNDHSVQIVGVDTSKGYWIVRNSWGTDWGINGFAYIPYNSNACGIFRYEPNWGGTATFYTTPAATGVAFNKVAPTAQTVPTPTNKPLATPTNKPVSSPTNKPVDVKPTKPPISGKPTKPPVTAKPTKPPKTSKPTKSPK